MKNIALVLGSFHKENVTKMLHEARAVAKKEKLRIVEEIWVPGSFEKPIAVKKLLERKDIDGVAVFGVIEKGETKNGVAMGGAVFGALIQLQLEFMKPVGIGIIGPGAMPSQIPPRLESFGKKAVLAVSEMLKILNR